MDILPKRVTYLLVELNTETNEYNSHTDRIDSFLWVKPMTIETLISRLATMSYFSSIIPTLKIIAAPLFPMARSKQFEWTS